MPPSATLLPTKTVKIEGWYIEYFFSQARKKDAPTIVFIPGIRGSLQVWHQIIPAFHDTHNILTFSLPPYGTPNAEGHAYTLHNYGDFLRAILKHFGIPQPLLVGHSMGGIIALEYLHHWQGTAQQCLIISAPLSTLQKPHPLWNFALTLTNTSPSLFMIAGLIHLRKHLIRLLSPLDHQKRLILPLLHLNFLENAPLPSLHQFYCDLLHTPLSELTRGKTVPLHFLYGCQDEPLRKFNGTSLYPLFENATIECVDGYHYLPTEHPEKVIQFIRTWEEQGRYPACDWPKQTL